MALERERERERESRNLRKIEEREGLYSKNKPLFICTTKVRQGRSVKSNILEMQKSRKSNSMKNILNAVSGITLIALVITIVVLLILASVSITAVFGDNGLLQLAKEAAEKTNEAVKIDLQGIQNIEDTIGDIVNNGWNISKVTAITSADGKTVPVPKGFVGSEATGENTVSRGFVIYEGTEPVTNDNVNEARTDRNQFVWIPVDGVSLRYEQDKISLTARDYKDYTDWIDEESVEEQKILKREESVAKYGGFYVGRYEAGVEESKDYTNGEAYKANEESRNNTKGTPVTKKERQAWNYVSQTNAKALSEKMYATSSSVTSRLIDSYAWDTICIWLSDSVNVTNSTSWGNYLDVEGYDISGLYVIHEEGVADNLINYNRTDNGKVYKIPGERGKLNKVDRTYYELATGISERNKAKNIYDFAGNMWEWTTEIGNHEIESGEKEEGIYAVVRGGGYTHYSSHGAGERFGPNLVGTCENNNGFRPVLYLKY